VSRREDGFMGLTDLKLPDLNRLKSRRVVNYVRTKIGFLEACREKHVSG
jgi:hypothetical protein